MNPGGPGASRAGGPGQNGEPSIICQKSHWAPFDGQPDGQPDGRHGAPDRFGQAVCFDDPQQYNETRCIRHSAQAACGTFVLNQTQVGYRAAQSRLSARKAEITEQQQCQQA
jgi:hypothetical protein